MLVAVSVELPPSTHTKLFTLAAYTIQTLTSLSASIQGCFSGLPGLLPCLPTSI